MYALWYPSTNSGQGAAVANSGATIGGQFAVRVVVQPNSGSIITASVIHQSITEQTNAHAVRAGQLAEFEVASPNPQYGDPTQNVIVLQSPFVNLAGHNGTYEIQVTVRYVTGPIPFHYGVYEETATMTLTMSNLVLVDSREEPYFVWKPDEMTGVPFSAQLQHAQAGTCTVKVEVFTSDNNVTPILVREFTSVPRPGVWQWEWDGRLADGSTAPRGIYLYRLSAEAYVPTLPDRDSNRSDRLQVISTELDYDYEELEWITRCRLSGVMSSARVDVFSPVSLQTIRTTTDVQVTSDGFLSRVEDFARDEGGDYVFLMRAWDKGDVDGTDKTHRRKEALPLNQRARAYPVALVGTSIGSTTLNDAWERLRKCPAFRRSPFSGLLTFTPPRGENTAVFINCTADTARYYLNETASGTRLWMTFAHGAGEPSFRGYGIEFARRSWLWSHNAAPKPSNKSLAFIVQVFNCSPHVIMPSCWSGLNREDPRSLMGVLRDKGTSNRVSWNRYAIQAEVTQFYEGFTTSIENQIRKIGYFDYREAIRVGTAYVEKFLDRMKAYHSGFEAELPVLHNEVEVIP
jgi:hypothetical protein